ncbi:hypothetical protein ACLB2K_034076 [Fragaria x ananassa]
MGPGGSPSSSPGRHRHRASTSSSPPHRLRHRRSDDLDLIKKSYRRLALLLLLDKNKYAFADHTFRLIVDAWAVLSDPTWKTDDEDGADLVVGGPIVVVDEVVRRRWRRGGDDGRGRRRGCR